MQPRRTRYPRTMAEDIKPPAASETTEEKAKPKKWFRRTRGALRWLAKPPPIEYSLVEDDALLTGTTAWRDVIVGSARACTAHARHHQVGANGFLQAGILIAAMGVILFVSMLVSDQWAWAVRS